MNEAEAGIWILSWCSRKPLSVSTKAVMQYNLYWNLKDWQWARLNGETLVRGGMQPAIEGHRGGKAQLR